MRPVIITGGRKAIFDPNQNRMAIQFLFPKPNQTGGEHGEIDLINGDMPGIVVKASAGVEVDRADIVKKEDRRRRKK